MARGQFITLEGGEGSGKSSLARALVARLTSQGRDIVATREPGGAPGADLVRALLVQGDTARWSPLEEALLFATARLNHLQNTIRPALARGAWVVCDRYYDSTMAYQVAGGGLDVTVLRDLNEMIEADRPDLTLIMDIDPAIGLARSRGGEIGEDRFEKKGLTFHQNVRDAFRAIALREPERCVVLDASQSPEAVLAQALAAVEKIN